MKVEYGCRTCIALAESKGLKEWPLYPREQVVRKGDYTRSEVDSDCILYQMLKMELRNRMALRNPARDCRSTCCRSSAGSARASSRSCQGKAHCGRRSDAATRSRERLLNPNHSNS